MWKDDPEMWKTRGKVAFSRGKAGDIMWKTQGKAMDEQMGSRKALCGLGLRLDQTILCTKWMDMENLWIKFFCMWESMWKMLQTAQNRHFQHFRGEKWRIW